MYLPQDELAHAGLSDDDIFAMKVTNKWRVFMKKQIKRARTFFAQAEEGVTQLSSASRWPVCILNLNVPKNNTKHYNVIRFIGHHKITECPTKPFYRISVYSYKQLYVLD